MDNCSSFLLKTDKYLNNVNHICYNNLYYIKGQFLFLTTEDIKLPAIRLLGGPLLNGISNERYILQPDIIKFETMEKLNQYVTELAIENISGITNYFSHYYDHNIAHGLYDALYPSFLTYLEFYKNSDLPYTNLINILTIPGWVFPGNSSRQWVLDIFQKFAMNPNMIINNLNNLNKNYKFATLLAGSGFAGISSVNRLGLMPGKEIQALEKFRDRMYNVYSIKRKNSDNNFKNILIINSRRYSASELNILQKINSDLNNSGFTSKIISWESISSFEEQLNIMNNTDIHISGAGTSMLNFPFLNDGKININLGVSKFNPGNLPVLLEVNCCLLSNTIITLFYDIFKYREILYEPIMDLIKNNLCNTNKTVIPDYMSKWIEICDKDENMNALIERMNGIKEPNLIAYRHPEMFVYHYPPYN